MTIEVDRIMYAWNAGGYLLSTYGNKWTPASFTVPSADMTLMLLNVEIPPRHYNADALAGKYKMK